MNPNKGVTMTKQIKLILLFALLLLSFTLSLAGQTENPGKILKAHKKTTQGQDAPRATMKRMLGLQGGGHHGTRNQH